MAITPLFGNVQTNSISVEVEVTTKAETLTSNTLRVVSGLSALPTQGPLLAFLQNATFADANAAEVTWRTLGGQIEVRPTVGLLAADTITWAWGAAGGGALPTLEFTDVSGGAVGIKMEMCIFIPVTLVQ